MSQPALQADCAQCAGLCCVLLPFDKSDAFSFDKAGGEPCRHLAGDHSCKIHDELEARGFKGCVRFECYGAGQRVVQEVFDGADWRSDASLMKPMSEAFQKMRALHDLLVLLDEAGRLPLNGAARAELDRLWAGLQPDEPFTPASLSAFDLQVRKEEVYAFLAGLRDIASKALDAKS